MATSDRRDDPVLSSLREHVTRPLSTAIDIVETERGEVESERRAFSQFKERVAGIEARSAGREQPDMGVTLVETPSKRAERVRSAFRDTVMSVDHYDERYGESPVEHAAAELSTDVAPGFRRDAGTAFTEFYKLSLTAAVDDAVDQRERLCDLLDAERASLATSRRTLAELLDSFDRPRIPARGDEEFEDRLDDLARTRQTLVHRRDPHMRAKGHELCGYLYGGPEWTYPVLTAVTRFRTAVTEGDGT